MATPPVRTSAYLDRHVDLVSLVSPSSLSTSPDPTDYLEAVEPKRDFSRDGKALSVKSTKSSKSTKSVKSTKSQIKSPENKRTSFKHMLGKRHKKPTLTDIFLDPDANDSLYTCHATDMLPKPKHYKVRRWKNHKSHKSDDYPDTRDTETDTYYDSLGVRSELRKYVGSRGSTNTTQTRLRYPVCVGTGATAVVSGGATSDVGKSSHSSGTFGGTHSDTNTNTWTSSWRPAGIRESRSLSPDRARHDPHLLDVSYDETPQLVPERETFMQRLRHRFRV